MHVINSFVRPGEQALAEEFAANGYVVRPVDDREALDELRRFVAQTVCDQLKIQLPNDVDEFLNHVERVVPIEKLNEVRLNTYRKMNAAPWFRPTYFGLARSTIETLVGNELAMQNRVNLSIQLPRDDSSLLAIHADAFGGETPFQVVEWLPLVDCYKTKSMFILPRAKSEAAYATFTRYEGKGMDLFYKDVEKDVVWCNVPYGHVLVFSPNLSPWRRHQRRTGDALEHELPLHRAVHALHRRREEARLVLSSDHHAAGDENGAAISRAVGISGVIR